MAKKRKVVYKEKGPKDDGSRYSIFRDERQVYAGEGLRRSDAERICSRLILPAEIRQVKESQT